MLLSAIAALFRIGKAKFNKKSRERVKMEILFFPPQHHPVIKRLGATDVGKTGGPHP
jgi:hypothetical protein